MNLKFSRKLIFIGKSDPSGFLLKVKKNFPKSQNPDVSITEFLGSSLSSFAKIIQ